MLRMLWELALAVFMTEELLSDKNVMTVFVRPLTGLKPGVHELTGC